MPVESAPAREPRPCPVCPSIIADPPAAPVCLSCGYVAACPDPREWDKEFKAFIWRRWMRNVLLAPGQSESDAWKKMLVGSYRGTWMGDGKDRRIIPWASNEHDIYTLAHRDFERSQREGACSN